MRVVPGLMCLLVLAGPRLAIGQPFVLHGSAGPTLIDTGYSVAAGVGFSPASHVTILLDFERTHLSSRLQSDGRGGLAGFRGGTLNLATGGFMSRFSAATASGRMCSPDSPPEYHIRMSMSCSQIA